LQITTKNRSLSFLNIVALWSVGPWLLGTKKASYLHRTATTIYPCCVPTLGDSTGAGRVGLANCKYTIF